MKGKVCHRTRNNRYETWNFNSSLMQKFLKLSNGKKCRRWHNLKSSQYFLFLWFTFRMHATSHTLFNITVTMKLWKCFWYCEKSCIVFFFCCSLRCAETSKCTSAVISSQNGKFFSKHWTEHEQASVTRSIVYCIAQIIF